MTTGSAAMIEAPFEIDLGVVPAAWIDANGHMNVLQYLEASEQATAAFYEVLGIGVAYRTQNHCGMFAAEHHIVYKAELRQGDPLRVTSVLCDCDEERIHFLNRIYRGAEFELAAAIENVELHVDLATRRVAPFRARIIERLRAMQVAHAILPRPADVSRVMGLRRGGART
jgi:acyl-CoA thioester hydrolase